MDSSSFSGPFIPTPLHHHHHHRHPPPLHNHYHHHHHHHHHYRLHPSPHCPYHNFMDNPLTHSPTCPLSTTPHGPATQFSQATIFFPFQNNSNSQAFESKEAAIDDAQTIEDNNKQFGAEEDEEPVFVLTAEWREFFAKSEAKRKLAKKQAKKKRKG